MTRVKSFHWRTINDESILYNLCYSWIYNNIIFINDGFSMNEELEILAIKVRNGEIPPDDVLDHFKNDAFLKYFKNKYRKEIYGMSPDFLRRIGYKKPTKKER